MMQFTEQNALTEFIHIFFPTPLKRKRIARRACSIRLSFLRNESLFSFSAFHETGTYEHGIQLFMLM